MKYIYISSALILVIVGVLVGITLLKTEGPQTTEVPEGSHMMSDGTLMRNDMGTEGMGSLSEFQEQARPKETTLQPDAVPNADAKVFEVRGINYGYDVKEIRVKKGDTVTINFESTDGFHDWVVDAFNAKTQKVQPGTPTSVTFVADTLGTYEYYCSVGQHRAHGMTGTLVVEE